MKKGTQLIGMPVVAADSRKEIDHIQGLVLDPSETHVRALLVDCDASHKHARIISLRNVSSFGRSAIAVSSAGAINDVKQIPEHNRSSKRHTEPVRTRLVTGDGTDVGTVEDIVFNENTGRIDSFQCSSESNARKHDEAAAINLYEELDENVIVHASEVSQLDGTIPTSSAYFPSDTNKETQSAEGLTSTKPPKTIEGAKQLFVSMSSRQWKLLTRIGPRYLKRFWRKAKTTARAMYQNMFEAVENRRIQRACGRIAKSALYDFKDVKVVNQGEVITRATIERARKAGVLNELLDTVNRKRRKVTSNRNSRHFTGLLDEWWPPFI